MAIAISRGGAGMGDYMATGGCGLLLGAVSLGIGTLFGADTAEEEARQLPWPAWLMLLDPVDLFRLSVLNASRSGRTRFLLGLPHDAFSAWLPISVGWAAWLLLPFGLAIRRFGKLAIRTPT